MEWTYFNILISAIFVLVVNSLHLLIKWRKTRKLRMMWAIMQFVLYTLMFLFTFAQGATREQTLVILLLSLPCAFIHVGKESTDGI